MTPRIALIAFAAVMLLCIAVIGAGFALLHLIRYRRAPGEPGRRLVPMGADRYLEVSATGLSVAGRRVAGVDNDLARHPR
jgi:hypothetical protein